MHITKVLMLQVGTYNDMFQRPYRAHVDGHSMMALQESTHYGKNLTPAALSAVGSDIMRIDATAGLRADVINGYDSPRLCFMMEVEFPGTGGITQVEWLLGYTDDVGVSARFGDTRPKYDPNMQLTFNNVMRGRRANVGRAFGNAVSTAVNGTFQLINGNYRPNITNLHEAGHLMRPQDVFTSRSMASTRQILGDEDVLDARPTFGPERVAVNNRLNSIPGNYMHRMLETWKNESMTEEVDPGSLNSQMAARVAEPTISRIRSLSQLSTMSNLREGGTVTWRELCDATEGGGHLEDRTVVVLAQSDASRARLARRGQAEHWNGNGNLSVIATSFVQAVPGIMMSLMLTEMVVSITNKTMNGEFVVNIESWESFNGGDDFAQVEAFKYKLERELMPGLSRGGQHLVTLHADFSVMGETLLELSVDDSPMTPFVAPTFCDGLSAAVRAPNERILNQFSTSLGRIMDNLEQDFSVGTRGYDPTDDQHTSPIYTGNHKYENSGSL